MGKEKRRETSLTKEKLVCVSACQLKTTRHTPGVPQGESVPRGRDGGHTPQRTMGLSVLERTKYRIWASVG